MALRRLTAADKLASLRALMREAKLSAYVVPTSDAHMSEYVSESDKRRSFLSNFTGSAGTAVVTETDARLWTDGRYFLQANTQLDSSAGWSLMKDRLRETPTIEDWLASTLRPGQTVGCDPFLVPIGSVRRWQAALSRRGISLFTAPHANLVDKVWGSARPAAPKGAVEVHPVKFAGKSHAEKIEAVRDAMRAEGASALVLTALDEIAWLFNIRGSDVECNPVVISYAVVTLGDAFLFVDASKMTPTVRAHLGEEVRVVPYEAVLEVVSSLPGRVWLDPSTCNWAVYEAAQKGPSSAAPASASASAASSSPADALGSRSTAGSANASPAQSLAAPGSAVSTAYGPGSVEQQREDGVTVILLPYGRAYVADGSFGNRPTVTVTTPYGPGKLVQTRPDGVAVIELPYGTAYIPKPRSADAGASSASSKEPVPGTIQTPYGPGRVVERRTDGTTVIALSYGTAYIVDGKPSSAPSSSIVKTPYGPGRVLETRADGTVVVALSFGTAYFADGSVKGSSAAAASSAMDTPYGPGRLVEMRPDGTSVIALAYGTAYIVDSSVKASSAAPAPVTTTASSAPKAPVRAAQAPSSSPAPLPSSSSAAAVPAPPPAASPDPSAPRVIEKPSPIQMMKSLKNATELEGMRSAHIRDGAALVSFLAWLEAAATRGVDMRTNKPLDFPLTEYTAGEVLDSIRGSMPDFVSTSFDTIAGFGPNGAIIHYRASKDTAATLNTSSVFLLDSGGQYRDGTTDVTRTVHFGTPTPREKAAYTAVLQGHIGMSSARFPEGTSGIAIDALARAPLWQLGLDYRHGTGHGVGAFLNVHEGPQYVANAVRSAYEGGLREGMTITDEPGYYEDGAFGIRIENVLVVRRAQTPNAFGAAPYLEFEPLTCVPISTRLVDASMLSAKERRWLNDYNAWTRTRLTPLVKGYVLEYLLRETYPV
jgi:Xaa-Pro aminopeptidase